jgi:DNA-binding winged helix-turn-helix (wHTH) protein
VSWRGDAVTLKPRALRLLRALARHHPDVVTRAQLWREVFPEEHTRTGDVARGVNPDGLDSRLRQAVAEVRAALGDDVVANARGGERAGGYRLALPEGLLSRPVPG